MRKPSKLLLLAILLAGFALISFGQDAKKKITIDDITSLGTFRQKSVYGIVSMKSGESYTVSEARKRIVQYSYKTGEQEKVLFDFEEAELSDPDHFTGYKLSPDETMILMETERVPIYRHSYKANYFIYTIADKSIKPLSENGLQQLATFSPNGKTIAFVRDNNIFLVDVETGEEKQITSDGKFNFIINGAADWVYEEEFALKTAMQWSPDGKKLAFFRFDETNVKEFNMTYFNNELYPENYAFKYPKAGEANSIVSIHVYDLESENTAKMDIGEETDQYIARINWTTDANTLSMIRLNRLQNKLEILLADAKTGSSKVLYAEENKFYIEEPTDDYLTFTDDGKYFVITSEMDGWNHVYLYNMDGTLAKKLTTGENEVFKIYGVDSKKGLVYYQALDNSPLNKAVYSVSFDGKKNTKLSTLEGTNSASFSNGFKYFIHFHSSVSIPNVVSLHNQKGKLIRNLEENEELKSRISEYEIPAKEFFTFKTSEDIELNGYMLKPLGFDETKKYPVLMYQYSGPGSQAVVNRWGIDWDEYLASEGYLVVCVDGRGTGGRGEEFKKMTYGQMGYFESIDQIESAKYLQTLPYVEPERIGIWGWSYGGYMSSLCLFKAPEVFKMAIAVAPVTNWRYYDSVYTERFMGLPQLNPNGYDDNSPINHAEKLQGKLLLVHGTGDDNVHMQNTMELAERLIQANKPFDMMLYPDRNHSIYGNNARQHLYNLLTRYVKENL